MKKILSNLFSKFQKRPHTYKISVSDPHLDISIKSNKEIPSHILTQLRIDMVNRYQVFGDTFIARLTEMRKNKPKPISREELQCFINSDEVVISASKEGVQVKTKC